MKTSSTTKKGQRRALTTNVISMNWPCRKCIEISASIHRLPRSCSKFYSNSVSPFDASHIPDTHPVPAANVSLYFRFWFANRAVSLNTRKLSPLIDWSMSLRSMQMTMLYDINRKTLQITSHLQFSYIFKHF